MPAVSYAWEAFFSSAQLRRWSEAISLRFSCRKFKAPADIQQKSALHYAAARAGLPGVRLALGDCDCNRLFFHLPFVERIEYASQYVAVIIDKSIPKAVLHAGIAGQALALEMTSLHLGSCWVAGNFHRSSVGIPLKSGEHIAAVMPIGQPQSEEGASLRKRKPLRELCLDDPATWPLWAFQAVENVRGAPSARNSQPWRFSFFGNTLRISGRHINGINFGIAILHIECALRDLPHRWRYSTDEKSLLIALEETYI
jgi:hypothetical protein